MKTRVTSLRLGVGVMAELRRLAHLESLRLGREVSASALVRALVEQYIRDVQARAGEDRR
jgi:hypothetical protein